MSYKKIMQWTLIILIKQDDKPRDCAAISAEKTEKSYPVDVT
jgi:hypothetical protein